MDNIRADLGRQAFAGLAKFVVAMALLLFLPAWSLRYWQGWLFLIVFCGACFVTTLYFLRTDPELVRRRMAVGPTAETEPAQKRIMATTSIGFVLLILVPALDDRWQWSNVPTWLVIVGNAGVLASFYLIASVLRQNSFAAATIQIEANQKVVSTGAYAIVRHPMYAAALPLFFFTPLALGSYWGLLIAAAMIPALMWRLLDEEKYLARNLPGYDDYRRTTPYRLIPLIW
jgi:protein-S-isoprenylcysteine O-methyltransferase Ste14